MLQKHRETLMEAERAAVLKAQEAAMAALAPGNKMSEPFKAAVKSFTGSELMRLPCLSRRLFSSGDSFPRSSPYLLQSKPCKPPPDLMRISFDIALSLARGDEQDEDEFEKLW